MHKIHCAGLKRNGNITILFIYTKKYHSGSFGNLGTRGIFFKELTKGMGESILVIYLSTPLFIYKKTNKEIIVFIENDYL